MTLTAIVRAPSPLLDRALSTDASRPRVDAGRAAAQHAAYVAVLQRLGCHVRRVPEAPDLADGVFVEDTVVIVDDVAVMTRPGADSRRQEVDSVAAVMRVLGLRLTTLRAPARLDGGDVLQIDRTVYVGRSERTNDAAVGAMGEILAPLGRRVVPVDVHGCLHLKTAATALPDGTVVAQPAWVDHAAFGDRAVVPAADPGESNVLCVRETVVVRASAPALAEQVAGRGFAVETVDVGEFEKVDGGLTCMSILVRRPDAG